MATYTYTNLIDQIADPLKFPDLATQVTTLNIANRAARMVVTDVDLRSTKRKAAAVQLVDNEYDYTCPTDLKAMAIIDFQRQKPRSLNSSLTLTRPEEFDRKKSLGRNAITVSDADLVRKIRFAGDVDETNRTLATFDSLTADSGTWVLFGDGTALAADTDNYVEGGGALKWNISAAGGTTAGVQNTTMNTFDISAYVSAGSAYVRAWITSTTNLTNFKLRIGMDTSANYYEMTTTTQADGTAFTTGWNILKFGFAGVSETGTVTEASCDSIALYMTKTAGKVSEIDYRFDGLTLHTGDYHQLVYYSKYPWQTSAGTFIENSTTSTDKLNADTEEFDGFVWAGKRELYRELHQYDQFQAAEAEYQKWKLSYSKQYRSEKLKLQESYY